MVGAVPLVGVAEVTDVADAAAALNVACSGEEERALEIKELDVIGGKPSAGSAGVDILLRLLNMDEERDGVLFGVSPTKLSSVSVIEGGLDFKFPVEDAGEIVFVACNGTFLSSLGELVVDRGMGVAMSSGKGLGEEPS